ncbi:MAG: hypothetical protein ACI841_001507 [Planctomycetota bacterium]|jgi:hypothetical protein
MSLLFPLYLAGIAAIGLPVLFHMLRRTPQGRVAFSSLMFLRPSPPKAVRRRKLDHVALLLLRALAIALIALAFARPFQSGDALAEAPSPSVARVAILLDTSASMRRGTLFADARKQAREVLDEAGEDALVSLATMGRDLEPLVTASVSRSLGREAAAYIQEQLASAQPTWSATDIGGSLSRIADELVAEGVNETAPATIVLISDWQRGADFSLLESRDWPDGVRLVTKHVSAAAGNAGLSLAPKSEKFDADHRLRLRVRNDSDSTAEHFRLVWSNAIGQAGQPAESIYCPPGSTRVVRAPSRPEGNGWDRVRLEGDDSPFDNVVFDREQPSRSRVVLSIGSMDEAAHGTDFFLEQLFGGEPEISGASEGTSLRSEAVLPADIVIGDTPLIIWKATADQRDLTDLIAFASSGGVVLATLAQAVHPVASDGVRDALRVLMRAPSLELGEHEDTRSFSLLSGIDFGHPLFAPFSDPRFSDFTKIHIWRHRVVSFAEDGGLDALVTLDSGGPLLLESRIGQGRVILQTAGWSSDESDLPLSTKFAPLMHAMLALGARSTLTTQAINVGDTVALQAASSPGRRLQLPDGSWLDLDVDARVLTATHSPGHYQLSESDGRESFFTVQLDPDESRTDLHDLDPITHLGIPSAATLGMTPDPEVSRAEHRVELEGRQQAWRWFLLAALGALLLETLWSARLTRRMESEA